MMKSVAINRNWYNEIKDRVTTENPYFYTEEYGSYTNREMVEVDVNEEEFEKVSAELGWM
jgi:hypothetical protein